VRRVLALIREETSGAVKVSSSAPIPVASLANFIAFAPARVETAGARKGPVDDIISRDTSHHGSRTVSAQPSDDEEEEEESEKALLMQALGEIQLELESVHEGVSKNAQNHIHNECVVFFILSIGSDLMTFQ